MDRDKCTDNLHGDIPIDIVEQKTLFHGKWLGARQIIYRHKHPDQTSTDNIETDLTKLPMWQVAYRTTTPKTANVDGVNIIATLLKTSEIDSNRKEKYLVLVKQFRVPMMKYSLEFPAGLLDPNETVTEAGIRELREETGYTATRILGTTKGIQTLDPGLTDDSVNFVIVEIDGDSEVNHEKHAKQKLDEDERIEVILIPFDGILEKLREYAEQGLTIEAMVYSFALGTSFVNGRANNLIL